MGILLVPGIVQNADAAGNMDIQILDDSRSHKSYYPGQTLTLQGQWTDPPPASGGGSCQVWVSLSVYQ